MKTAKPFYKYRFVYGKTLTIKMMIIMKLVVIIVIVVKGVHIKKMTVLTIATSLKVITER